MKTRSSTGARLLVPLLVPLLAGPVWGGEGHAHEHGVLRLNVAIEGPSLILQLEAPLDSLLGFERAPRTPAEHAAAAALLKRLAQDAALWRPEPAAQCGPARVSIDAPLLQAGAVKADGHADLDASIEFRCERPALLSRIELGLFAAFPRSQRIEVQVVGPKGQSQQRLKRPNGVLKLTR